MNIFSELLQIKPVSGSRMFASPIHLCYSNGVVSEQWSLPVAFGPAQCESREVGSWFVGSNGLCFVATLIPVGNPTENKPLHDPGVHLPRALVARAFIVGRSFRILRSAICVIELGSSEIFA